MNENELKNKVDAIYRETANIMLIEMSARMNEYLECVKVQGYDTRDNVERNITSISNSGINRFNMLFITKLNAQMTVNELLLVQNRITGYQNGVEKIVKRVDVFVMSSLF